MIEKLGFGDLRGRRPLLGAATLWLLLGFSGTASATTPPNLQDMFDGSTFTQDGLKFFNFTPGLANSFPLGQDLLYLAKTDPLALFNVQYLEFAAGSKFSRAWGNANAAIAADIGLLVLADNVATPGVDPGFRLNSATQWTVTAGNIASGQLSAFAYDVETTTTQQINSAEITQSSTIDAVGPDVWSFFPFSLPDVATGFALQLITDLNSNDVLNVTLDIGVQSPDGIQRFSQFDSWSGFADHNAIRVVNVIGLGASSGGGFTMVSLEQRIDPPAPAAIPEPGTLLLISLGLLGIPCCRRRASRK